jgi:hypothetical protein
MAVEATLATKGRGKYFPRRANRRQEKRRERPDQKRMAGREGARRNTGVIMMTPNRFVKRESRWASTTKRLCPGDSPGRGASRALNNFVPVYGMGTVVVVTRVLLVSPVPVVLFSVTTPAESVTAIT